MRTWSPRPRASAIGTLLLLSIGPALWLTGRAVEGAGSGEAPWAQAVGSPSPFAPSTVTPTPISATPVATPSPAPTPTPTPSAMPSSSPASGTLEWTLTASAMSFAGLDYAGVTTVPSGGVSALPVLDFTMTGASAGDLAMTGPCTSGVSLHSSTGPGAKAIFAGPGTLYLTYLQATDASGTTLAFTPSSPPPPPWLYTGPYTALTMVVAELSVPQLVVPRLTITSTSC